MHPMTRAKEVPKMSNDDVENEDADDIMMMMMIMMVSMIDVIMNEVFRRV